MACGDIGKRIFDLDNIAMPTIPFGLSDGLSEAFPTS